MRMDTDIYIYFIFFLMHRNMIYMERVEVDAHTMYIPLRIGNRSESGWTSFLVLSNPYFYNIWRPSTFLCTYGKNLYMGIGMLIKMRA